jgi:hypothetical protein
LRHQERAARVKAVLSGVALTVLLGDTHIFPVMVGDPEKCKTASDLDAPAREQERNAAHWRTAHHPRGRPRMLPGRPRFGIWRKSAQITAIQVKLLAAECLSSFHEIELGAQKDATCEPGLPSRLRPSLIASKNIG